MRSAFLWSRPAVVGVAAVGGASVGTVENCGQESKIALGHAVSGHLAERNDQPKLRVSEAVYALGGFIGEHHHAGRGIRVVRLLVRVLNFEIPRADWDGPSAVPERT
jgi:hypothetical protein